MAGKQKPLVVVVFEHNSNSDENVVEVYATEKAALRRCAEIANHNTEGVEVEQPFARGDYETCVDLFIQECEDGTDHRLNTYVRDVKTRSPQS
jgi:hypothetical protein